MRKSVFITCLFIALSLLLFGQSAITKKSKAKQMADLHAMHVKDSLKIDSLNKSESTVKSKYLDSLKKDTIKKSSIKK